ncbi:Iron-sulfur assembly protein 1 [Gnomoniopsis sp. IMI 355080]|nr:Iron-sulfur assembly protein 1 [Gnomoniopsis sp. IMI 355080]
MNAVPITTARRATSSICLSCKRSLFRQFTSASRLALPDFQSYRLNPQPPSPPRSAGGPDTSITHPIEPPMPRVHETRPLKTPSHIPSIREELAQQSQPTFTTASQSEPIEAPKQTPAAAAAATPPPPQPAAAPKTRPRSKLRTPRKAAMKLTPAAVEQLRALLDQPEPKLIKVGVRNRGCSGLAYHLEYVDKAGAFDEAVEQDGVKVLIDSKALFSIIGSEMDWVEDKLNERFVFRNPNIKEQCGCGESFMV